MTLSTKTWHYWLYKTVYGKKSKVPDDLCSYFWKLVFAVPYTLVFGVLFIPLVILESVTSDITEYDKGDEIYKNGLFSWAIFPAILACVVTGVAFCLVAMWFVPYEHIAFKIGLIAITVAIIGGAIVGGQQLIENWRDRKKEIKKKNPNILIEFIKAKKNKYCPRIEWKDKN